jgi:hypothetical protein
MPIKVELSHNDVNVLVKLLQHHERDYPYSYLCDRDGNEIKVSDEEWDRLAALPDWEEWHKLKQYLEQYQDKEWDSNAEYVDQRIILEDGKSYEIVGKDFRLTAHTLSDQNTWFWLKTRKIYNEQLIDIEGYDEYSMSFKIVED